MTSQTVYQITEILEGLPETFSVALLRELKGKRFSILQRERERIGLVKKAPAETGSFGAGLIKAIR